MKRVYNFCAGPSALPTEVLEQVQDDLLSWNGKGFSIMETSHRGDEFLPISQESENDLRELLNIPENYKVLFLQGGASIQFSQIALNFLHTGEADYVDTGIWSTKAFEEASRLGKANVAYSAKNNNYTHIEEQGVWIISDKAKFIHYASNETIGGLQFHFTPKINKPLFVDMSSDILSKPINVSDYDLIYAGAQKNIGPSGLVIVIIKKDLLEDINPNCPTMLNYKIQSENGSMYNTPPTFSWYVAGLVFKWLKRKGGIDAIYQENLKKANFLYDFIDKSNFYYNGINKKNRSLMNIPFVLKNPKFDVDFLNKSQLNGLVNLKGHRSVGGMRASIYNAITFEAVKSLVDFMEYFADKNG